MTLVLPLLPKTLLSLHPDTVESVDLETGFNGYDTVSIALPNFPLNKIDTTQSYVEFTSNSDGNFVEGPNIAVLFSQSISTLLNNADCEFSFLRQKIEGIDLTNVTGVRLILNPTANCTVKVMGMKLLSKNWVYPPVDLNTRYGKLVKPVSRTGAGNTSSQFPVAAHAPIEWPILWKTDSPSSSSDPSPVDSKLAISFTTGSMTGNPNRLSVYLRELGLAETIQFDLDGETQDLLDANNQPDFGEELFTPRTQANLDLFTQMGMALSQFDLERYPDPFSVAYIEARLEWGATQATLKIYGAGSTSPIYSFDIPVQYPLVNCTGANLCPNSSYVMLTELQESGLRIKINRIDLARIGIPVFDTTLIVDPETFYRRKGRIGWYSKLVDGDASINALVPRYMSHAEYRSHPFESETPIVGAQLFIGGSGTQDLAKGLNKGPFGGDFEPNPKRSPFSFKVKNTATKPLQGVQTNSIWLDDFGNTEINFSLLVTAEALKQGTIEAFLWDGYQPISLPIKTVKAETWSAVNLKLNSLVDRFLPGFYSLVLVQSIIGLPNDWYVDKIEIKNKILGWEGRSFIDDAWGAREKDWIDFGNALNTPLGGAVFRDRSKKLQVRGRALRQQAQIGQIKVIPRYAPLGRFVWRDEQLPEATYPLFPFALFFFADVSGLTVSVNDATYIEKGYIAARDWFWGDGKIGIGPVTSHTYEAPGVYPVTLVVTDNFGNHYSVTEQVTV